VSDLRVIKASFRECPVTNRKQFKVSSSLVLISMDSSSHEGKKFKATLDLVDKSFKNCTILIGDTLYRHNLRREFPMLSEKDIYLKTLKLGDNWIERNQASIERLSIPYQITRWDKWVNHPDFENSLLKIKSCYNTDNHFKSNFDLAVKEYLQRGVKDNKVDFTACLSYLKEECAVMTLWVTNNYDFELYPSGRNKAMSITYEYLIKPKFPNLLHPVSLRFKKIGNFVPD
jgi:hypothetical protein